MLNNNTERVALRTGENLDAEAGSPALEAALLKSIDGPYTPYSSDEMRGIVERIIREENRCGLAKAPSGAASL